MLGSLFGLTDRDYGHVSRAKDTRGSLVYCCATLANNHNNDVYSRLTYAYNINVLYCHAKNKFAGMPFYFERLDPGSGRKIPAMWHGAGAYSGVVILET